jgi:hypothetical protein
MAEDAFYTALGVMMRQTAWTCGTDKEGCGTGAVAMMLADNPVPWFDTVMKVTD